MATPPLGFIEPNDRTQAQADAHAESAATMVMHGLPPVTLNKGDKIVLTDALDDPAVIADMGMRFPGFRQLTGACVGVTEGEITAGTSALQRVLGDKRADDGSPTKAFIPWWPYAYGRTRFNEGDRGQGEGAVSSVMGKTLESDGTFARDEVPGLPAWDTRDGLALTKQVEYAWSDGGSPLVSSHVALGQTHRFGARTPLYTVQDHITLIANGYFCANGCAYFVGGGSVVSGGGTPYVRGRYDGRGGHETSFNGVWYHPNDGILFGYWNHWDASTYPTDPAGLGRCQVWLPESELDTQLTRGGIDRDEAFAVSHVDYFPAQVDKILDWARI